MPRTYSVTFEKVSVSAVQDLLQIKGAANKLIRVKRLWLSDVDVSPLPAAQMLALRMRFLPATVTDGSGGSSPTPRPVDPGDAAATFTAKANDTVQATSTGTVAVIDEMGCHIYTGFDKAYPDCPWADPSTSITFELITAPSGTLTLSGGAFVEETG